MIRVVVIAVLVVAGWLVAATQVPSQVRLPLSGVVPGAVVAQPFGCTEMDLEPYDPACLSRHFHTGIDLAAPEGSPVYSATDGTAYTGYDPMGAGNFVAVRVDPHVRIVYCHLSTYRVSDGESITAGQLVGLVGATGLATGPHVHFQVDVDGEPVDPLAFLGS